MQTTGSNAIVSPEYPSPEDKPLPGLAQAGQFVSSVPPLAAFAEQRQVLEQAGKSSK